MSKPGTFLADIKEIRHRARQHLTEGAVTQNYGGKVEDAIVLPLSLRATRCHAEVWAIAEISAGRFILLGTSQSKGLRFFNCLERPQPSGTSFAHSLKYRQSSTTLDEPSNS